MPRFVGEGMTGSRPQACPPGTEPGTWTRDHIPDTRLNRNSTRPATHSRRSAPRQHAPNGVGVKAKPLRGRPRGPRLDPDADIGAPTTTAERQNKPGQHKHSPLTRPRLEAVQLRGLGGWVEADLVAEGFEVADVVADRPLSVGAPVMEVRAEVDEVGRRVG